MEWKYLTSPCFRARLAMAAYYTRQCEAIIEIGGYKTPITQFLGDDKRYVFSIDPLIVPPPDDNPYHYHIAMPIESPGLIDTILSIIGNKSLGLIALGIDLHTNEAIQIALRLSRLSHISVLETALDYSPSMEVLDYLLANSVKKIITRMVIDMSGSQVVIDHSSYHPRFQRIFYVIAHEGIEL